MTTRLGTHHTQPVRQLNRLAAALLALLLAILALALSRTLPAQAQGNRQLFIPLVPGAATSGATAPVFHVQPVPNQYIVVFNEVAVESAQAAGVSTADAAQALVAQHGGELLYTYDAAIHGFAAALPAEALAAIQADPRVAFVEQDQVISIAVTQTNPVWGLDRIDQAALPLNQSYVYNTDGAGVHVYVVDTGVRATHTEFEGRIGAGFTAVLDGQGTNDCNGHGTHVAGTVGGKLVGVAKKVILHPVRVLNCQGSGTVSQVVAGVDWVTANHIDPAVANLSLGGGASTALDNAVRNAIAAGVTFAVAAGNENKDACSTSPARVSQALTVGASTSSDGRASFSNYGTCVDLFAPGSSVTSASRSSDTTYATYSGTSMASPHVAGAAALYLAANPTAKPADVAAALVNHATQNKLSGATLGSGSPNRLLYTGFIQATPVDTTTPTHTPTPTN
ncbi:MAG TPA: S8 family serine peptidase, partial [Caldilineaceae bacterium]|nr:S8 family serine peptidase [Caldilineaceae bacterium]